jgi:iron(III) transport system substrate-binding protein
MRHYVPLPAALLLLLPLLLACGGSTGGDVVIYCALDEQHSSRLIRLFEEESGLEVKAIYDRELTKTVGLVNQLVEEASDPRCDVFWNNEIVNTVKLKEKGILAPYRSPAAESIPARWRDPEGYWTGFAARARVFIVNTELVDRPEDYPTSLQDFLDPEWRGRCAMARPRTGTTLTHFAALYRQWSREKMAAFHQGLVENQVGFMQGNAHVMRQVRDGKFAWGLTDTDDLNVALSRGFPVTRVYPGQAGRGTMVIPNTVCLIKNCPHPEAGKKLIDFILSPRVEEELAAGKSAQIPVRTGVPRPDHVKSPSEEGRRGTFKAMPWDPEKVGAELDELAAKLADIFR